MLEEKQKQLLSLLSKKPTSEIQNRYDDIIVLQSQGYKLKDILSVYIKTNVLPENFSKQRFYDTLYKEKIRREKKARKKIAYDTQKCNPAMMETEKEPLSVSAPIQVEKEGFVSPTYRLADEEKAERRAEKRRQQEEKYARRRAAMKTDEKTENSQLITIDHVTKTFKINDLE
jgi:hypothetical protein